MPNASRDEDDELVREPFKERRRQRAVRHGDPAEGRTTTVGFALASPSGYGQEVARCARP